LVAWESKMSEQTWNAFFNKFWTESSESSINFPFQFIERSFYRISDHMTSDVK
jgi:hypothetical protein